MSLYNMLFGVNPHAGNLLALLDLTPEMVGRFRDAYLAEEDGEPIIVIHTRNGGGNREHWGDVAEGPDCGCTGCIMSYRIPRHPLYLRDRDDDFDCTYADVIYRVPPRVKEILAGAPKVTVPPAEMWQRLFAEPVDKWPAVLEELRSTR